MAMHRLRFTLAAVAAAGAIAAVHISRNNSPGAAKPSTNISRAVFAEGRLWLLTQAGSLASITPEPDKTEMIRIPGESADICVLNGRISVISFNPKREIWVFIQRYAGRWVAQRTVPTNGEALVALNCDSGHAMLVTSKRLIDMAARSSRSTTLSREVSKGFVTTTSFDRTYAWIGYNSGEWGGGLTRIRLADGKVETIESNRSGNLCGGPLNTECDPVNAILPTPWKPQCIVAAIGLQHMMSHGRIVEVCGNSVRRIYFKPFDPQPPRNIIDEGEPSSTVSFHGLARTGNIIWGVGIDGLYRFSGPQPPTFEPLPRFEERGDFLVSFAVPGIALVTTTVNGAVSMGGAVPMIVAR